MSQPILFSVFLFATIALGAFGIDAAAAYRRERRRLVEKIQGVDASTPAAAGRVRVEHNAFTRYLYARLADIGLRFGNFASGDEPSRMHGLFLQAGIRGDQTLAIFVGFKFIGAAALAAGALLVRLLFLDTISPVTGPLVLVSLTLLGWYLPDILLRLRIANRKAQFLEGFPDVLDLMVVCVDAGLGLDAALARVGEEMHLSHRIACEELRIVSLELRAGKMRRDALHALSSRIDLEEVRGFVSLLVQTDRFGTSVAQALRVHADYMRIRRAQRAEEYAAKLPVKLLFPLLVFIFPCIFMVIVGPAAITIFRTFITLAGQ